MRDNVVLIGMMGCGKSTVGKLLAQALGFAFVDTDQYIEAALGRSIPDIFATEGEAFFRDRALGAAVFFRREAEPLLECAGKIPVVRKTRSRIHFDQPLFARCNPLAGRMEPHGIDIILKTLAQRLPRKMRSIAERNPFGLRKVRQVDLVGVIFVHKPDQAQRTVVAALLAGHLPA